MDEPAPPGVRQGQLTPAETLPEQRCELLLRCIGQVVERAAVGDFGPQLHAQTRAAVGERDAFHPPILRVGLSLDEASGFEPVDQAGEIGSFAVHLHGEPPHRAGTLSKPPKDVNLSHRKALFFGDLADVLFGPVHQLNRE